MLEEIDIKRRDGIAHIVLNRPSAMSAVTLAMWRELAETFARFVADSDLACGWIGRADIPRLCPPCLWHRQRRLAPPLADHQR